MGGGPQLNASEWARPEVLFTFIDELRHLGWNLGTAHYGAAQDLLLALVAEPRPAPGTALLPLDGPGRGDRPERLARLLGPLLCSTPREQEDLPRLLARWGAGPGRALSDALAANECGASEEQEPHDGEGGILSPGAVAFEQERPLAKALERIERGSRAWPAAVAVIVVILGLAALYYYETLERFAPVTPPWSPPSSSFQMGVVAGWLLAAAGVVAGGYLGWRLWLGLLGRQFLVRRSAVGVPALQALSVRASTEALFAPRLLRRSAEQLRRRVAQPGRELDLAATVERSARQGGWPALVTASQLVRPEYLVLIERANPGDQRSRYFDELAEQLAAQGVVLERAYFDGDPRTCYRASRKPAGGGAPSLPTTAQSSAGEPVSRSCAAEGGPELSSQVPAAASRPAGAETSAGVAATPVGLRELYSLYPDRRLLLVSNGDGLFSAISGEEEPWVDQLLAWKQRALLVPRPVEEWGRRERELARRFAVVPATLAGWADLAAVFAGKGAVPSSQAAAAGKGSGGAAAAGEPVLGAPLPEDLRLRPWPWLGRNPPEPWRVERMLDELERSLGDAGFYWLAACAVYPALDWEMTISLGRMLAAGGEPLHDPRRLAALLDLPWLRLGTMPDWLRKKLLARLSRRREAEVRGAIAALLLTTLEATDPRAVEAFTLEVASRHRHALTRLWRPVWRRLARRPGEDGPVRDYVFRDFMAGRHRRLAVALPEGLARFLARRRSAATQTEPVDSPAMRRARLATWLLPVVLGLSFFWAVSTPWVMLVLAVNVAVAAVAYVWRRPGVILADVVVLLILVVPGPLLLLPVAAIYLLVEYRRWPLGPMARAQRLARVRHVLIVAGGAYLLAGAAQAANAGFSVHLVASGTAFAATVALLTLGYSERSAWLLLASAPVALPGLVWLLIRGDPFAILTPAEARRSVLLLVLGAAACFAAWRSLRLSAPAASPIMADRIHPASPGRVRAEALKLRVNLTLIGRSVVVFASLFLACFWPRVPWNLSPSELADVLVNSLYYPAAILCAIYLRARLQSTAWTITARYVFLGLFAAGVGLAINAVGMQLAGGGIHVAFLYTAQVMPAVVAVTLLRMIGDTRTDRLKDGLMAGALLAAASTIPYLILAARNASRFFSILLVDGWIRHFGVGFAIGFLVPIWYQQTRRKAIFASLSRDEAGGIAVVLDTAPGGRHFNSGREGAGDPAALPHPPPRGEPGARIRRP
jgi:hypothetical protein